MRTISFVGRFVPYGWGEPPNENHLAEAATILGASIVKIASDDPLWPGKVVPNSFVLLAQPQFADFADTLRRRGCIVGFWTLDDPDVFDRRHIFNKAAAASDWVFSTADHGLRGRVGFARIQGACPPMQVQFDPRPVRPVAWLGGLYNARRQKIAEIVQSLGGEVVSDTAKRLYGHALARFVQETKVIVGDNSTNATRGYWSDRNYVIPGMGGFLLTAYVPGLDEDFGFNQHIAIWNSESEIEAQIRRWIIQDQPRETIRRQGFEHVHRVHTWTERAKVLLRCVQET